jgi:hypothetical protein
MHFMNNLNLSNYRNFQLKRAALIILKYIKRIFSLNEKDISKVLAFLGNLSTIFETVRNQGPVL